MLKPLIDAHKRINVQQFVHAIPLEQTANFDYEARSILREHKVPCLRDRLNEHSSHKHKDKTDRIVASDVVWFDDNNNVVAMWLYARKRLYCKDMKKKEN